MQAAKVVFDGGVHVIVVGCGRTGAAVSLALAAAGHSISVIDKNEAAFRRLPRNWGGSEVLGAGFDRDRLEEAGVRRAGALAAVTSGDNSNILTARIARDTYGVPAVVARIYDARRAEIYERLGISTVATVPWTMEQVVRKLFPAETKSEWSDPTGSLKLVVRALPAGLCGRRISAIEQETGAKVVGVTRTGSPQLGCGELIGQDGDVLHLAVDEHALSRVEEVLGAAEPGGADKAGGGGR